MRTMDMDLYPLLGAIDSASDAVAGELMTAMVSLPEFQTFARALAEEHGTTEGIRPGHLPTIARLHSALRGRLSDRVTTATTWHWEYPTPMILHPDGHARFEGISQAMFDVHDVRVVCEDDCVDESVRVLAIRADHCAYPVPVPSAVLSPTDLKLWAAEHVSVEIVNRGHHSAVVLHVSLSGKMANGTLVRLGCTPVVPHVRRFRLPAGRVTPLVGMSPSVYRPHSLRIRSDSKMDVVLLDVRCGNRIQLPVGEESLPVEMFADGYEIAMDTLVPNTTMQLSFQNQHATEDRYVEIDVGVREIAE